MTILGHAICSARCINAKFANAKNRNNESSVIQSLISALAPVRRTRNYLFCLLAAHGLKQLA